jgi:threonine dehydrogenase-like Zn-dependent dehydrogenase
MRAITVTPLETGSLRLEEREEPAPEGGPVLVEGLAVGVCGTDREILEGHYGEPPPGRDRLVLGHESLGRVLEAPPDAAIAKGDLVPQCIRPNGIVCLTGLASGRRELTIDANRLNRWIVLENNVVFGSVNANRAHDEAAATALARADRAWLEALITRRVPIADWQAAYRDEPGDVKTVLELQS